MSYLINPYVYKIPRTIWYNTLGYAANDESINESGGALKRGEAPNNGSSTMIGQKVGQVIMPIKHAGTALTGTIYCYVRNVSSNNIVATIGTLDASTITSSYADYTFTAVTSYTLTSSDTISIECSWSESSTQYIITQTSTVDRYDGSNSGKSYYFTNWSTGLTNDMIASISD